MESKVVDKLRSNILGRGVEKPFVSNGEREWSERVRSLLLAQPLNPLAEPRFRTYEKETAIAI